MKSGKEIIYRVVIPVYNSEAIVGETIGRTTSFFDQRELRYELILINDGSWDDSWKIISEKARRLPHVTAINLLKNYGQHNANMCGFKHTRGDFVITMDDDLQNPPEEIPKLLTAFTDDIDLVTTVNKKRQDGLLRVTGSKFLRGFGQMLFGKSVKLNLSSFRAMRRSVIDKIETCRDRSRYMAVLMSWMGLPSVEIEVEHHPRKKGTTKYSFLTLFKLSWDLVTGYSNFPLRLVTYMGLFGAFMGFLMMAFLLYQRIANGILIEGFVVLSAVFAFFAGVQLLSIGFLGEYLGRVHSQIQGRPDYIVEKVME